MHVRRGTLRLDLRSAIAPANSRVLDYVMAKQTAYYLVYNNILFEHVQYKCKLDHCSWSYLLKECHWKS